ncbi:hypothetical protein AOQ84DRAFT_227774 [Glonium stellatum]|uniref:Uncharacterized protein n=1 Tax=Glonium stellatum TaxID=574774 RepID=A0A8E2JMU8_9PEZI|nr:hypothetical protein AOQ84DRAFT_227774 [Glonium stellatum]
MLGAHPFGGPVPCPCRPPSRVGCHEIEAARTCIELPTGLRAGLRVSGLWAMQRTEMHRERVRCSITNTNPADAVYLSTPPSPVSLQSRSILAAKRILHESGSTQATNHPTLRAPASHTAPIPSSGPASFEKLSSEHVSWPSLPMMTHHYQSDDPAAACMLRPRAKLSYIVIP